MRTQRQNAAKSRAAILAWAAVILCTMLPMKTWGADPVPLGQIPVPEPPNLAQFVKDKAAAIRLGKALFWDMQAGSDGVTACASCHYRAGADPINVRSKNQLSPRTSASGTSIFQVKGANSTLTDADFPFFQVNPFDALIGTGTVLANVNDVVGSQGVRLAKFAGVILGSPVDDSSFLADPTFIFGGNNVRQVTGRNAPSALNAVFNFANFWDGRASNLFNGSTPLGPLDVAAGIWIDTGAATLAKQPVAIPNASLASQSVGPPLSEVEMSFRGRTFPELGRKMLSLTPLGQQTVHPADSVLGSLANAAIQPDGTLGGARGINATYSQMIKDAFQPAYWNSALKTTDAFSQMEANFSLFWGLAIQLYEATLVSDQTPFDKYLSGDTAAMGAAAQNGFSIFSSKCATCHSGAELTDASVSNAQTVIAAAGTLVDKGAAGVSGSISDIGFSNIGVRLTADDPGRGGVINFPLSFAGQTMANATNPGSIPFVTFPFPGGATAASPVAVDGAFKIPLLRNVELTPPYFHNGSAYTLDQVVEFYARGGNFANTEMDVKMKPIGLLGNPAQRSDVVEFLKALTDPRVKNETAPFDHPELLLPQGDPELPMTRLLAQGAGGQADILPTFTMTVSSPTGLPNPTISGTLEKVGAEVMANPNVSVNGGAPAAATVNAAGNTWSFIIPGVPGLQQGDNTVTATATDLAGVTRTVTKTILAGITQPVGTITINNGATVTGSPIVTLNLAAAGPAPVNFMQFSVDGVNFSSSFEKFSTKRGMTLPSGDGIKAVYVKFKDSAGNESTVCSATIILDTVPPDLTISVISPTRYYDQTIYGTVEPGSTLNVTVSAPATVSDIKVNGGTWSAKISGLKEGVNTVTTTATDPAGNIATQTAAIIVDTKEPFLNIDTAIGSITGSVALAGTAEIRSRIEVECEEINPIVVKEKIKADVIFFDDFTDNVTRWSAMILGLLHEEDILFHHEVDIKCKVKAIDAAGNENVKEVEIKIDDVPPALDFSVSDTVSSTTPVTISGTVEPGTTPSITVNGSPFSGTVTVNGSSWSALLSGLTAGANTVTVTATDAAGNVATKTATVTAVSANGSFTGALVPTVADALKALRIAVGLLTPTAADILRGDMLVDGKIDVSDAILILQKVVGF